VPHPFVDINPIAFSLGPVQVHWYGIMYLIGFAAAWWLGQRRRAAGRLPVTADQFSDLAFYGMLGVILGGRIGYMVFYDTAQLIHHPTSLFRVWEGGMSFHGGLLGVVGGALIWLGVGRLGNFIGGELWGRHTDAPWGMIFPRALEALGKTRDELYQMYVAGELNGEARHPSQLYEFCLEGVVLFTVLWFYSRKPRPRYAVSGLFALLYGLFRFCVEFVREPDVQLGFVAFDWLTMGQILSLPLIAIGIVLLWLSRRAPTPAVQIADGGKA